MALLRRIARPMLSSIFVIEGIDAARHPKDRVEAARPVIHRISDILPSQAPSDEVTLVRINGITQAAAGLMLAAGRIPRVSSAVLAASLIPTTVAGHSFWEEDEKASKKAQKTQFLKNLSILGGLLIASADTGGKPSLGWRARYATQRATRRVHSVARTGADRAIDAADSVRDSLPGS